MMNTNGILCRIIHTAELPFGLLGGFEVTCTRVSCRPLVDSGSS